MGLGLLKKIEKRVEDVEAQRTAINKEKQHSQQMHREYVEQGHAQPTFAEKAKAAVTQNRVAQNPVVTKARQAVQSGWNTTVAQAPKETKRLGTYIKKNTTEGFNQTQPFIIGLTGGTYKPQHGKARSTPGSLFNVDLSMGRMFRNDQTIRGIRTQPLGMFNIPETNPYLNAFTQPRTTNKPTAKTTTVTTKSGAKVTVREPQKKTEPQNPWDF